MSTARAARFAAWEAERATWRLANRGDTRYALERRVFRKQLRDMRRSLKEEDLLARRAAHVAARASERERTETPEGLRAAEERAAAQDEVRAARAAQVEQLAAEARRDFERYRARAAAKRERLDAARAGEGRAWLEQFLERNDVSGRAERGGLGGLTDGTRSISWVQPHNLEARCGRDTARDAARDASRDTAEIRARGGREMAERWREAAPSEPSVLSGQAVQPGDRAEAGPRRRVERRGARHSRGRGEGEGAPL